MVDRPVGRRLAVLGLVGACFGHGLAGIRVGLGLSGVLVGLGLRVGLGFGTAFGAVESFGEDPAERLIERRLARPFGLPPLGVAEGIVEILRGRQQVRVGEHLVPGLRSALRLEVGEERSGIAETARVELQTHESGEGLLGRTGSRPTATQGLADLIAARQVRTRRVDDDVDPAGDDGEEILERSQGLLLVLGRRRVEQTLANVVAEIGDVRGIDRGGHVLDLRSVHLEALGVAGQNRLDLGGEPGCAFEQRQMGELLCGQVDADFGDVDVDLGGERGDVRLDERGGVIGQEGEPHLGAGEDAFGQGPDGLTDLHREHRIAHRPEHR